MRRARLDKIDLKILTALQEDGRMTNVDLAKHAGISAPPCLRRVRALEEAGFIKSYHARLDAHKLGYTVVVFAHIKLESHSETDLKKFEEKIQNWPMVRECHMVAGEMDYILKIVAKDWDDYQNFLTHQLTSSANVHSVRSSLAIQTAKVTPGIPMEEV